MTLIEGLRGRLSRLGSKGKRTEPNLVFSKQALTVVSNIHEVENPNLHEIPFLGVVDDDGNVEEIISIPDFRRQSRLRSAGGITYKSTVDKNELATLFQKAHNEGKLDRVKLVGHLHPTGSITIGNQRFIVPTSDFNLEPSQSDISFMGALEDLNPDANFDYIALTSNTPEGRKLRVYKTKDLKTVKKASRLDKIPLQTIDLK